MPYSDPITVNLVQLALAANTQEFVRLASKNKKAALHGERAQQAIRKTSQNLLKAWPHLSQELMQEHVPYLKRLENHLKAPSFSQHPSHRLKSLQKQIQQAIRGLEPAVERPLPYLPLEVTLSFLPLAEGVPSKELYGLRLLPNSHPSPDEIRFLADKIFIKYQLVSREENSSERMEEILQQIYPLFFQNLSHQQELFFKQIAQIITLKCGGREEFLRALLRALPSKTTHLNLSSLVSMPRSIAEESTMIHLLATSENLGNLRHLRLQTSFDEHMVHNKRAKFSHMIHNKEAKFSQKWNEYKTSIEALAGNQHLNKLQSLGLINYKHPIHEAIVILSNNPAMSNLEQLDLSGCDQITDATLSAIAKGHWNSLRDLNLSGCHRITNTGLLDLISSETIKDLERLNLLGCDQITEEAITTLAHSPLVDENTQIEASEDLKCQFALAVSKRFQYAFSHGQDTHALVVKSN